MKSRKLSGLVDEPGALEQRVDDARLAQQRPPRVDAHQIARHQRRQDEHEQQAPQARLPEDEVVRERVAAQPRSRAAVGIAIGSVFRANVR